MEAIIFTGIQGSGKSTFYRERFFNTHMRVSLDMLRTRNRERLLLDTLLMMKQPFVVDNTNPTVEERLRYIEQARAAHFRVVGYYFRSVVSESIRRNAGREGRQRVPVAAIGGTAKRLQLPEVSEGFDTLYYVSIDEQDRFKVEEWSEREGTDPITT